MEVASGVVILLLGAVGATIAATWVEQRGEAWRIPYVVIPFGVLIGAGGALIRGWHLVGSAVAGAVLAPLVALVLRLAETRWRRHHRGTGPSTRQFRRRP